MCKTSRSISSKFQNGIFLGNGAFGEVRDVEGWAIKQINSNKGRVDRSTLAKEIYHLQ